MRNAKIQLDTKGIRSVLSGADVASAVRGLAEQAAGNARAVLPAGTDVVVDSYTTDRAAASVTIRDGRGRLWQVRDGVLTRAASALGLEVTAR